MTKYQLVNPYIEGDFQTSYSAKTPDECAEQVWDNLSGYLTGNVPKFAFTLKQESNNKLYHFLVKESVKGDLVDYSLTKLNIDLNKDAVKQLNSKINKFSSVTQNGGKKSQKEEEEDDDDDSSSDDELEELYEKVMKKRYKHQTQPILYWWYTPSLYQYTVGSVFCPTFVVPLTPYVEIYPLSTAFWGN
uniref:Uncharacterized protein n=1 Tax=viral metagenome TaxID=1070528 RepID=A0A6C0ACD2_9ZZZZ